MTDIRSMLPQELEQYLLSIGQPKFRAKQLFKWLQSGAALEEMSNIPKSLREQLERETYIADVEVERMLVSKLDGTVKFLFRLHDGEYIEAVVMSYHHGYSMCISTQVGCKMGCTFCATGQGGFVRDLTASEMLAQITKAQRVRQIRISNIVLMGMGEPLDNYDNVMRFLELLSHPDGICIGQRHVSLSTCGLCDRIDQLAQQKPQFTLSVSLHAPNDEMRSKTMPVNKKYNINRLLSSCRAYAKATGRRISFEYALISGVNDSDECALELASRLRGMLCHVNLIPVNDVAGSGCRRPDMKRIKSFVDVLERNSINATVRRTLGSDINASCGQLRRKTVNGEQSGT